MIIRILNASLRINVVDGDEDLLYRAFEEELFPRRYIPEYTISNSYREYDAVIDYHMDSGGFSIEDIDLDSVPEKYGVRGGVPGAYVNESPYFFILQVFTRILVRKDYLVLTDSVSFIDHYGRVHLVLGYPHDGKSSILVVALSNGGRLLTTENTILKLTHNGLVIVGGTRILVYDPRVFQVYDLRRIEPDAVTKHGYHIVDLGNDTFRSDGYRVDDIVLIHASFRSSGVEFERVTGRKILKTLWSFSASLLRGLDYYEPYPLDLSRGLEEGLISRLRRVSELYRTRFFEAFGSHRDIYQGLARGGLEGLTL